MAALQKFNVFTQNLAEKIHDFKNDSFKVLLTNVAPVVTNAIKTDITEISPAFGYVAGGISLPITSSSQSNGVEKVVAANVVFTATGGSFGPFRYIVIYNSTQSVPNNPLVMFGDYGASITLNAAETLTVNLDQTNGLFTLG